MDRLGRMMGWLEERRRREYRANRYAVKPNHQPDYPTLIAVQAVNPRFQAVKPSQYLAAPFLLCISIHHK